MLEAYCIPRFLYILVVRSGKAALKKDRRTELATTIEPAKTVYASIR